MNYDSMLHHVDEIRIHHRAEVPVVDDTGTLLHVLLRCHADGEQAQVALAALLRQRRAGQVVRAMLANPARDWTLNQLADRGNVSRSTLVRAFRRWARIAPLKFLTSLRLELARRKLRSTDLPLSQIAYEVGYRSDSAFSRAYRRHFGMPPSHAAKHFI
ncbi:MAG: AraC family transcriptional regulator [Gammaproteobacteria bacterium]|nr:AraC family transcriptional regulator [Gammaproteobacteria bacterium]